MPQARRAQSGPVVRPMVQNTTPISAPARAQASAICARSGWLRRKDKKANGAGEADGKGGEGRGEGRHVVVNDAEDLALHGVVGRNVDGLVIAPGQQREHDDGIKADGCFFMDADSVSGRV